MAAFLGRDPGDIVFTSGGTEAANLAVLGTVEAPRCGRGEAVRAVLGRGAPRGARVGPGRGTCRAQTRACCPSTTSGVLDLDALARTLVVALHARRRDDGQQRDRRRAAAGRRRRRGAAPRPAGVRLHRRGAGRALPRPRRGRRRRRPGVAQRPQGGRPGRHRCAGGGPAGGPDGAPARRRAGARAAQRHPGRGRCGRARHGAATRRGRASRGGAAGGGAARPAAPTGCLRRCPTRVRTVPRRTSPSCPGTCTCACRGSSARSCWWPSAGRGSASRAARRVPAARSSPATSSPPWASRPSWPQAPSASPWATAPPRQTSTVRWPSVPGVVGRAAPSGR